MMIRLILLGRTGNHLFQYALGQVLARKHGVPLVLDASWFNAEGWREVSHFLRLPIQAKVVRPFSLASRALRNWGGKHYWEYRGVPVLKESNEDQSFDRRFLDAPADCVLFGYFQTPWYFQEIADELRDELNGIFSRGVELDARLVAMLGSAQSVAVHVRRGDFLKIPAFQVCDAAYYQKAIAWMRSEVPGARFWIFSDDPEWCRSVFRDADQYVMDEKSMNPLHDLYAMSLASHHIIANSTYSWWAAWIGKKPGQRMVMPERWYAEGANAPKAPIEEKWIENGSEQSRMHCVNVF